MEDLDNRKVTWAALIGGALALGFAVFSASPLAIGVSALFFFLTLLLWKYGYLLLPALLKQTGIVELRDNYEIPSSQDYIIKKVRGKYYASIFLGARIYESATEKSLSQKALFMEYFERAISSVKPISKFCILVSNIGLSNFIDEIKSKRSFAETKRARLLASGDKTQLAEISKIEREIAMWNRQLEKLSSGEKPMEVISYVMTTGSGLSREEAVGKARMQAGEIKAVLENALNLEVTQLSGEEMKKCFEWEFALPPTKEEMEDAVY